MTTIPDWPTLEELTASPPPPIQGKLARLCVDCEAVYDGTPACPHCGSAVFGNVMAWLDKTAWVAPAKEEPDGEVR